jgi:hypothetical protein
LTIVVANTAGKKINAKTVNGGYGLLKRGLIGAYQHCAEQHLRRSLAEFDFRYSNRVRLGIDDAARAERASLGAVELGAKAIRSLAPRRTRRSDAVLWSFALAICSCPPEQKRLEAALAFAARLRRLKPTQAPVAQLDRAPDYESGGREFESLRARQLFQWLACCFADRTSTNFLSGYARG